MLKAALIGFGGIAKAHRKAFAKLEEEGIATLICAHDVNPEAFHKKITINIDSEAVECKEHINFYTDLDEMFEKEQVDFVDICVPSFLHSKITCDVLRRGYHVMCEKPMALSFEDCSTMIQTAKENGKELMIGQCLRFYPAFDYIKTAIDDERFGKVIGAFFSRISEPPVWGWENWFMDPSRSGGCITDLHIHDVDIIRYLFGEPKSISCRASTSICIHDTVHTSFFYENNTPITAIGDWSLKGIPFRAECRIDFEGATVTFDKNVLTVYPKNEEEPYVVPLPKIGGHLGELEYFCRVISGEIANTKNPATSAATTVRLVEHMRKSADNGGERIEFH
ncbi:MAG: Gfo/Idh/MocA family oxidoreductase [Ruminococcaceae bacterium]|nr:Gfo/Idh/MocA family oxidoreductase [Oscillospiraceae bacterium]